MTLSRQLFSFLGSRTLRFLVVSALALAYLFCLQPLRTPAARAEGSTDLSQSAPTAEEFGILDAPRKDATKKVDLAWNSVSESQIVGYNVWRKRGKGNWKQLNGDLIPAKNPGSLTGASYEYVDSAVKPGKMHKYRIQVVRGDGCTSKSDKVKVKVPND